MRIDKRRAIKLLDKQAKRQNAQAEAMRLAYESVFVENPGLEAALEATHGKGFREKAKRKEERTLAQLEKIFAEDPGLMGELITGMRL